MGAKAIAELRDLLRHPESMMRDTVGLAFASIDDPQAIPWIAEAMEREDSYGMREDLRQVLTQLEATKREQEAQL